ncbi:zinc-binding dehydrogenase [Baekduia soli]|uniref:Zinc-binding dehydrogenase n=1 Tax=Baekduia soli TaxID=496014 RepID=A0A5B8U4S5_9ACTN|nr:zinc-binding dehydrogenase [Baekduia soli]QEC48094.1 zinc-binding dehydrogenase [Baekduia soli]
MPAMHQAVALSAFGPPEVLHWVKQPVPEPGPGEALVAVEAIGVNFADTMVRRGEYRRDQPLSFTPGFEVVGRVLEAPDGGPAPGTRVAVFTDDGGGYAETVAEPLRRVCTVPDDVPATVAATLLVSGVTAWYAVHRFGQVQPGEAVLVHAAAGSLGATSIQLVRAAGGRPIATASTAAKLEVARRHGAEVSLLSEPETLADRVRQATGGQGADVVVDGVGGPLFAPSMRALAFGGRYVIAGAAAQQPGTLDTRGLMPRTQTIAGFVVARVAARDPAEPQAAFDAVLDLHRRGLLVPDVTIIGRDDLVAAHHSIEGRRHVGKLVVDLRA